MAQGRSIRVKNLSTITNAIQKVGKSIESGVKDQVMQQTSNIEFEAQAKASSISGDLSIDKLISDSGLSGVVSARHYANADLAAYIEFGTGVHASEILQGYPNEVRELAMQFYVNGQGRMPSRPYLIPAFLRYRKQFILNIKKIVKASIK